VEAVLALGGRKPQLLLHDLLAGVVRQLEIVGAGHHAGQVVVRVHLRRVKSFLHDSKRRRKRLERPDGEARTASDELKEGPLLVLVVLRHDVEQPGDALALQTVAVIRFAGRAGRADA